MSVEFADGLGSQFSVGVSDKREALASFLVPVQRQKNSNPATEMLLKELCKESYEQEYVYERKYQSSN